MMMNESSLYLPVKQTNGNKNPYLLYKYILLAVYGTLTLGLIFNFAVACMIIRIFRTLKDNLNDKHMFLYILALCVVDTTVLSNLPLILADIVTNQWPFGQLICKLHWTTDGMSKVMSTLILTLLSFDRYLAVCHPYRLHCWRCVRSTLVLLLICVLISAVLLSPCYTNSGVQRIHLARLNLTLTKCVFQWQPYQEETFTYALFVIGYCIPLALMTFFHVSVLHRLWRNDCLMRGMRRRGSIFDITRRMCFVIVFYYCCWTPFWLKTFFIQNNPASLSNAAAHWQPILYLGVHSLVYLNSAFNPLLYGACNKEIQRQHGKARAKRRRSSEFELEYKRSQRYSRRLSSI